MLDAASNAEAASKGRDDENFLSFVTFKVAEHFFGVPVERVQDILIPDTIAAVPGGPKEVRGLINLRGRIVTVVDLRVRLSLANAETGNPRGMCVTVEKDGEFYTLLVDRVGDVVTLPAGRREQNPPTLDPTWRNVIRGVFRRDDGLLAILDIDRLLDIRADAIAGVE
jgi:purine-binding chemotaxis protein CheW